MVLEFFGGELDSTGFVGDAFFVSFDPLEDFGQEEFVGGFGDVFYGGGVGGGGCGGGRGFGWGGGRAAVRCGVCWWEGGCYWTGCGGHGGMFQCGGTLTLKAL